MASAARSATVGQRKKRGGEEEERRGEKRKRTGGRGCMLPVLRSPNQGSEGGAGTESEGTGKAWRTQRALRRWVKKEKEKGRGRGEEI